MFCFCESAKATQKNRFKTPVRWMKKKSTNEKNQQSKQECHTKQNAPQNCKNFKLRWVFGCIQAFEGASQKNMGEKGEATVRWYLYNAISGVYTHCADIFITEWVVGWTRAISFHTDKHDQMH